MSYINRKALTAVGIGFLILGALAVFAAPAGATEAKPCKEHATTTTTAKPKPTTTAVAPTTTTTEKPKPQAATHKPVASTTTTTEKPVEILTQTIQRGTPEMTEATVAEMPETPVLASSTQPIALAETGAKTTYSALLAAALTGLGMLTLWVRRLIAD